MCLPQLCTSHRLGWLYPPKSLADRLVGSLTHVVQSWTKLWIWATRYLFHFHVYFSNHLPYVLGGLGTIRTTARAGFALARYHCSRDHHTTPPGDRLVGSLTRLRLVVEIIIEIENKNGFHFHDFSIKWGWSWKKTWE